MIRILIDNVQAKLIGQIHESYTINKDFHESIRQELSYMPPNIEWAPKVKEGLWDGRISLYRKASQSLPTGLVPRVVKFFKKNEIDYKIEDTRPKPEQNYQITCDFGNKKLRPYQIEAPKLAKKYTRAMLELGTGAGKTMLSCEMLAEFSVSPVIFIVPSISLLNQTQEEFHKYIRKDGKPVKIGIAGGGKCDLNLEGINIVTYQTALTAFDVKYSESAKKLVSEENSKTRTLEQIKSAYDKAKTQYEKVEKTAKESLNEQLLIINNLNKSLKLETDPKKQIKIEKEIKTHQAKYDKDFKALIKDVKKVYLDEEKALNDKIKLIEQKQSVRKLIQECKAFIVDEAHLAAVIVEELSNYAKNAYYKIGLSATPWREDNQEIRMEGSLGRKVISVSSSDLIEMGYLVPPRIFLVKIGYHKSGKTYQDTYNINIINNWERNYRIKQFAEAFMEEGKPVLILVDQKDHGYLLESMIKNSVFIPGTGAKEDEDDDPNEEEKDYRRRMLDKLERNETIVIATKWANTGIDAPKVTVLILAGSNKSTITTYQAIGRVLRCVGKNIEESIENGKSEAIVIDFLSQQREFKEHASVRKQVYNNERAWTLEIV